MDGTMELQDLSFDENDTTQEVFLNYRIRAFNRNSAFDPVAITNFLRIEPTRFYTKGDFYQGKTWDAEASSFKPLQRTRQTSAWDLDTKSSKTPTKRVEDHVSYILTILEPHTPEISTLVAQTEKYSISFYLRWVPISDHGSFIISSNLLSRMAKISHFVEYSFMNSD